MSGDAEALRATGDEALKRGDWAGARAAFEAALAHDETPETLFGLGDALWWLGDVEAAIRCRKRAYAAFRRRPDPAQAAIVAMRLCLTYRANLGNRAASHGWLGRAARLVEDFQVDSLRGWVLLTRAHDADEPAEGERLGREAHEIARRAGDADLELCALSEIGAWLVELGKVKEGVALLDEALAASLGGEGGSLNTVVYTSCHAINSCSRAAAFERAAQWVRAIDDFSGRYGCPFLYTMCRTLYAGVLFARGEWARAETELQSVLRMAKTADRALYGEAVAKLAELRLAQGRIEETERLVAGFEDHVAVAPIVGAVYLARGEPVVAESIANRWLREVGDHRLESAPMLVLRAEAEIGRGDADEAVATARRLAALGATLGCEPIGARGESVLGHALRAAGDGSAARRHLDAAVAAFARLEMPFDAARARVLLAEMLRDGERETAIAEARAALAVFERLGAAGDADAAAALLRSLGARAARVGPRNVGLLTSRELEVLRLIGEGLSNREMAERLFVTQKTIEHHVARVLAKLDLRSRAQAAAYAARTLERESASN
jgi:DNA-binding CsgD family transcriptional regulator/predicted negative regulator of RcsB-dependent stress response